jgi:pimeloyl-ACP methyl ester carboxylesterase
VARFPLLPKGIDSFYKNKNMDLHFRAEGDGFPLILLHGLLGSADNWRTASKRLSEIYKVYALDLRNHGRSPHDKSMTYPNMAGDLTEFLDRQGISEAHIIGHSMGGKVAIQFTTNAPGRLAKLVVVDVAPKAYPPSQRPILAALGSLNLEHFTSFAAIDAALAEHISETPVRQFLLKNIERERDGGFRWRIGLAAITENYHELTKPIVAARIVDKPACFIRGSRSDYIQDGDWPAVKKIFPHADLVTIAGAGHWVHTEAPDAFHRVVVDFLSPE